MRWWLDLEHDLICASINDRRFAAASDALHHIEPTEGWLCIWLWVGTKGVSTTPCLQWCCIDCSEFVSVPLFSFASRAHLQ